MRIHEIINEMSYEDAQRILTGLGIDVKAAPDTLKKAYRSAAMRLHPDRGGSTETMKQLNAAYDVIAGQSGMKPQQSRPAPQDDDDGYAGYYQEPPRRQAPPPGWDHVPTEAEAQGPPVYQIIMSFGTAKFVNAKGFITREDMPEMQPSGGWMFVGLARGRKFIPFADLDEFLATNPDVTKWAGVDYDHGSLRQWGSPTIKRIIKLTP